MNERIYELAREAGFENGHQDRYGNSLSQELEKFAELIVRECCIALNPMLRDMISRGQGVDMMKQHFGVEL